MAKNASTPQLTTINNHLKERTNRFLDWKKYLKLPVLNLLQKKACNGRNIKENNDIDQ
jgi:hypothetical protein